MAITRKSGIVPVLETETKLLEAETSQNIAVTSLILGNVHGTNTAKVSLYLRKDGVATSVAIINEMSVAAGEAVQFFIGGKDSLFLEPGDRLSAKAVAVSEINATLSYMVETA